MPSILHWIMNYLELQTGTSISIEYYPIEKYDWSLKRDLLLWWSISYLEGGLAVTNALGYFLLWVKVSLLKQREIGNMKTNIETLAVFGWVKHDLNAFRMLIFPMKRFDLCRVTSGKTINFKLYLLFFQSLIRNQS